MSKLVAIVNNRPWRFVGATPQFVNTRVFQSRDTIESVASGLITFETDINKDLCLKKRLSLPIFIKDEGLTYNEAWNGKIQADARQHSHIAIINDNYVESFKQIKASLTELQSLIDSLTEDQTMTNKIYEKMGYKPIFNVIDVIANQGPVINFPSRFLPSIHSQAREVCLVTKPSAEIAKFGHEFKIRDQFVQYLILITPSKRWLVCARSAPSENPLPIENTLNEKVMVFEAQNYDQVISFLMDSGFDSYDSILDEVALKMAQAR